MNYDEALKIAREQRDNYENQVSGAWSLSEEWTNKVLEALNVSYEEAVDSQYESENDDLNEFVDDKVRDVRIALDVSTSDFPDSFWRELRDGLTEKYSDEFYNSQGHSTYFWEYVVGAATPEKEEE